jgi:hypothetical protein
MPIEQKNLLEVPYPQQSKAFRKERTERHGS